MARKVWFQLVDAATRGAYADTTADSLRLPEDAEDIGDLRDAVFTKVSRALPASLIAANLRVYSNRAAYDAKENPLEEDSSIDTLGGSKKNALIVEVPQQHLVPRTLTSVAELIAIPRTTALNEPETYAEECLSLTEWDVGVVHKIPLIWEFMSSLGGCTTRGEFFWRIEDKQVVSVLVDGWFRASSPSSINVRANKKSIVMGSPGIGKSTLLCLMAFYLIFKHKKNVLVYRRLTKLMEENCLLYLGYEGDKVVYFSVLSCEVSEAKRIYRALRGQHGASNVWLLLDGFHYRQIPEGIQTFNLLATSQQVDFKEHEITDAYLCLFPCWRKQDLIKLGEQVYHFDEEEMDDRFYYSGGSVRLFTLATIALIQEAIDLALRGVTDVARLLSTQSNVASDGSHVDRLRHTFIDDVTNVTHFTGTLHWQQMVDSEYVVRRLSLRLPLNALVLVYNWARTTGHGSLAGCALEIYIHRLAADNRLRLKVSEYDPPTYRKPGDPRHVEFKQVSLRAGGAVQWGTSNEYTTYLEEWRDNDELTYWFPACDNFPNIDSIVKLESTTSGKKGNVAYLQVTVAKKHDISSGHMKEMNKIFYSDDVKHTGNTEPPIFIAICPDQESCKKFVLNTRPEVALARKTCQVFVGYFVEVDFAIAADGPKNNISVKPNPPPHTHFTRSKRPRES
ncbi:hypothetical protein Pcac1_g20369 [Phytophthora cactorum]|nr:hypothetical protein Pcac1_g20369 [Phytophthora cactorum]